MDKAFDMIRDLVSGLTGILVGVIGLGVVAGIVFDNNAWSVSYTHLTLPTNQCV